MRSAIQRIPDSSTLAAGRRLRTRLILLSLIWLGFTGADWKSWILGAPAVVVAAWISVRLWPGVSWRWSPRGFSGDGSRRLPAGDIGVLIERLLGRLQRRGPGDGHPHPGHGHRPDASAARQPSRWSVRLERVGALLTRLELRLGAWPVAGALWLLVMGLITVLLAGVRS